MANNAWKYWFEGDNDNESGVDELIGEIVDAGGDEIGYEAQQVERSLEELLRLIPKRHPAHKRLSSVMAFCAEVQRRAEEV
jgi:hypothetical protein